MRKEHYKYFPTWLRNRLLGNAIRSTRRIDRSAYIKKTDIKGPVQIGKGAKIFKARIRGEVEVGNFTSISGPGTELLSAVNAIRIGRFCSIASGVRVQEYNHNYSLPSSFFIHSNIFGKSIPQEKTSKGSVDIGSDVWIGADSIVLTGVRLGHGSVVAANSVVVADVEPYSIVGGSPAKHIKYRFNDEVKAYLDALRWWDRDIEEIRANQAFFAIDGRADAASLLKYEWQQPQACS